MTTKSDSYNLVDQLLIPHTQFSYAVDQIEQCFSAMSICADPVGIAIVGESRTGKTRALEYFEQHHQSTRMLDGKIVPFLRAKVPSKPTVKGLVTLLLYQLGDPAYAKGTEITQTLRLITLMKHAKSKLLALDEFQHFYDKTTCRVQHHVADWLKVLVDDAQIGLIVTGLPTCLTVIEQNEQLAGRFMSPIKMPRFDWRNEDHRAEFSGILAALGEGLSMFDWLSLEDEGNVFRFYYATGGLIGYLIKLLKQVTWDALDANDNRIGLPELSRAYQKALVLKDPEFTKTANPFSQNFNPAPSSEAIAQVLQRGVAVPPPLSSSKKSIKPFGPTATDALAGRI